ncbi:MAG: hypothetical protein ACKVP7_14805 [Hyphomicrobiaceae bacterium]
MALFEALGEFVASALLSAAPACELTVPAEIAAKPAALITWLRERGELASLNAVVDAMAREIWVGAETRALSQQALEQHVQTLSGLLPFHLPSRTHLTQGLERARTGTGGAASEPVARRIAVDVFARARASGAISAAGLKDDVTLFLIDRVFAHLLDDPRMMSGLAASLGHFIGGTELAASPSARPAAGSPPPPAWHEALGLSSALVRQLEGAGGPAMLADVRERFGLTEAAMQRILAIIDGQRLRPDDMMPRFDELAAWLGDARAQLLKPTNEEADVRRLKSKAAAALADGDFEAAAEALRLVRRELREGRRRIEERLQDEAAALRTQMIEEARAAARLAELSMAAGQYGAAAELFSDAALNLPTADRVGIWQYNLARADALLRLGGATHDTAALTDALAAYSQAIRLAADGSNQRGLGLASLGLGNTLFELGERESGSTRLKDAIAAYRKALQLIPRLEEPRHWADAQLRLGRCLAIVGEREGSAPMLRDAAQAFRDALKEIRAVRNPADHALAQMGLGNVLLSLEEREGGLPLMEEAAESYAAALTTIQREAEPQVWADAQLNGGLALLGIGEQTGSAPRLEAAVKSFSAALEAYTRQVAPQKWALTQMNLGNALAALAERTPEAATTRLAEAIVSYTAALEEFRRDSEPLKWAITQMNLGTALIRLGDHKDKRRHWLAAAGALVPALEVFEAERADAYADVTRRSLKRFHESWEALIAAPVAEAEAVKPRHLSKAG